MVEIAQMFFFFSVTPFLKHALWRKITAPQQKCAQIAMAPKVHGSDPFGQQHCPPPTSCGNISPLENKVRACDFTAAYSSEIR